MQLSSQSTATLGLFCRPMKVAYPAPAVRSCAGVCARYLRAHWPKIAVAVIGGALAGFFAGAVSSRQTLELNQVVYAAGTATNASTLGTAQLQTAPAGQTQAEQNEVQQATQQEVSRLKAENHQLQALVDELQKERPAAHNRRVKTHHHRRSPAHA
ncbi:MAG TPA: hypothetical protein VHU83_25280 [Bryobacteraceae bacterium]|nr:hypothetical protein [Bryobacteraceae bacterium]